MRYDVVAFDRSREVRMEVEEALNEASGGVGDGVRHDQLLVSQTNIASVGRSLRVVRLVGAFELEGSVLIPRRATDVARATREAKCPPLLRLVFAVDANSVVGPGTPDILAVRVAVVSVYSGIDYHGRAREIEFEAENVAMRVTGL